MTIEISTGPTFLDVWWIPVIALALQVWATVYLVKIHGIIGRTWTVIFTQFQILGYLYIGFIMYGIFLANSRIGIQPLELFAIFFGLVYPVWNNITHLKMKRFLARGLEPNSSDSNDRRNDKQGSAFS